MKKLTGRDIEFVELDVTNTAAMEEIFELHNVEAVIHFAALKAVGESVEKPIDYYQNNIDGLLSVIKAMRVNGVKKLIFSSSATVYGDPIAYRLQRNMPLKTPTNPYGCNETNVRTNH